VSDVALRCAVAGVNIILQQHEMNEREVRPRRLRKNYRILIGTSTTQRKSQSHRNMQFLARGDMERREEEIKKLEVEREREIDILHQITFGKDFV